LTAVVVVSDPPFVNSLDLVTFDTLATNFTMKRTSHMNHTVSAAAADQYALTYKLTSAPGLSTKAPLTLTFSRESAHPGDPPSRLRWTWQLADRPVLGKKALKSWKEKFRLSSSPDMSLALPWGHPFPEYVTDKIRGADGIAAAVGAALARPAPRARMPRMTFDRRAIAIAWW
jgi:hypothetical protein